MQWFARSALAREISRTNPSPSILSFAWRQRLILVHESVRWHFGGICDMWYRWYNQCLFQVLNSNEYIVLNLPIISWMLPCNYNEWWSRISSVFSSSMTAYNRLIHPKPAFRKNPDQIYWWSSNPLYDCVSSLDANQFNVNIIAFVIMGLCLSAYIRHLICTSRMWNLSQRKPSSESGCNQIWCKDLTLHKMSKGKNSLWTSKIRLKQGSISFLKSQGRTRYLVDMRVYSCEAGLRLCR